MKKLLPILFLFCGSAGAQTVLFKVEKPKEAKLAERFRLEYRLEYQGDFEIKISTEKLSNSDFQLLGITKEGESAFALEVIPFNIGVSTFPSLEFSLISVAASYKAKSPEIPIDIKPFFEDKGDEKLIDIYPPFRFTNWLKWLLLAALLAPAAWLIYKKLAGGTAGFISGTPAAPDNRTPYQKAMDEISALLRANLPEKGEIGVFYISLSDILRNYIEREFLIQANHMTTHDLVKSLKGTFHDIKDLIYTREFLDDCDLVKFAKHTPGTGEIHGDVERLKRLIDLLDGISAKKKSPPPAAPSAPPSPPPPPPPTAPQGKRGKG